MTESVNRHEVVADSLNWFKLRGVAVEPSLLGSIHQFEFEGHSVGIKLPDLSQVGDLSDSNAAVIPSGRFTKDMEPLSYAIQLVEIKVNLPHVLMVDPETFNRNPVAYDLYSQSEQEEFERLCAQYRVLSQKAFEYWVSILRWKLNDFRIGLEELIGSESGWSSSLQSHKSSQTIWSESLQYTFPGYTIVDENHWTLIQTVLSGGETSPVYFILKHEAEKNLKHGNYKTSIIELAMASEIFLRMCVIKRLPNDLAENLVKAIEELNINQYVSKHFKILVLPEYLAEYRKIVKELDSLFSKRNAIVHMGDYQGATKENCERFLVMVESLFLFQEKIQNG